MPIETLLSRQNSDGGWPYLRGGSWTEPTAYAILALLSAGEQDAAARGMGWIRSVARPDGGTAPRREVEESTWVTSLVALLPPDRLGQAYYQRSVEWLLRTAGQETSLATRLREYLRGYTRAPEQKFAGWPWMPGAAAWVGPTSLAILALRNASRQRHWPHLADRVEDGRQFLLVRMCQEGGWNHGSVHPLGYEAHPYPETTGMALAALAGVQSPKVEQGIAVARRFLEGCRSADAWNWLRLGLAAHGRWPADDSPAGIEYRTTPEIALSLLAGGGTANPLRES